MAEVVNVLEVIAGQSRLSATQRCILRMPSEVDTT